MRIISGKFRGRVLAKSSHLKLRPTTDKNREALFNILVAKKFGFELQGSKILDMCCGTGAVGFEALSRGASSVTFVDLNRSHLELVKQNSQLLAVEKDCEILCFDAKKLPKNSKEFDLIFLDPPYEEDCEQILQNMLGQGWILPKTLLVIETQSSKKSLSFGGFSLLDSRKYGITSFYFLKL